MGGDGAINYSVVIPVRYHAIECGGIIKPEYHYPAGELWLVGRGSERVWYKFHDVANEDIGNYLPGTYAGSYRVTGMASGECYLVSRRQFSRVRRAYPNTVGGPEDTVMFIAVAPARWIIETYKRKRAK